MADGLRMGKQAIEPAPIDTKQKAALRRLERVTGTYEFVVTVRKTQFAANSEKLRGQRSC